jgi:hypothetical protein
MLHNFTLYLVAYCSIPTCLEVGLDVCGRLPRMILYVCGENEVWHSGNIIPDFVSGARKQW